MPTTVPCPAASRNVTVPSSIRTAATLMRVGVLACSCAAAGAGCGVAPAASGANCQLRCPFASVSSRMSGLISTSWSISIWWVSSGISDSRRSSRSSVAICGREKPGGLAKATPWTVRVGRSDSPTRIGPWRVRSRPVCCFTAATIRGFRLSGSNVARNMPAPMTVSPTTSASDHSPMRTGRGRTRDAGRRGIGLATPPLSSFRRSRRGR